MKAKTDLYCPNCGTKIYSKGDEVARPRGFTGNEQRCKNCDETLQRRSPGGQSDTWNFTTRVVRGCPSCGSTNTSHNSWCRIHLTPIVTKENKSHGQT